MTETTSVLSGLWANVSAVLAFLTPIWEGTRDFANSGFTAALAGAFAGAWAAQRIAERSKSREESLKEIRSTNAALVVGMTIAELGMAIKKQYVRSMKAEYDDDQNSVKEYLEKPFPKPPLQVKPNLTRLQTISPPIAPLQSIVLGEISANSQALRAVSAIADGIGNLNSSIVLRNDLIESLKAGNLPAGMKIEHMYFGLPVNGSTNNEYRDTINGISSYTDDVIFFSLLLCDALHTHGLVIARKYKESGGEEVWINDINLLTAVEEGLIPQQERYDSWLSGVQILQQRPKRRRRWWHSK